MQLDRSGRLGVTAMIVGGSLLFGWLEIAAGPPAAGASASGKPLAVAAPPPFLPLDAKPTCVVTPAAFAGWFESGAVTLNGVVKPANSVTFPNIPNCSFYQWSHQMFLWLTSPAPARYGGGSRIFDSPTFYDVSPLNALGERTFVPHVPGKIRAFSLKTAQAGPNGLPIVLDKSGRMFEVEEAPLAPSGKQQIRDAQGDLLEVASATFDKTGGLVLRDKVGAVIDLNLGPQPQSPGPGRETPRARKLMVGKAPVFLDAAGKVIEVEQGQAGAGEVLEAQNGSLVYYSIMVNDVFAYFLTGAKTGGILPAPTQFPTTNAQLNQVIAFAAAHGKTFPDPEALAIEIKTSWVEVAGLANPGSYITMTATIPTYDKTDPKLWVQKGETTTQLALVGMHVVGSTAGHPEMIWGTFEHFGTAPNATYSYIDTANVTRTVPQNTAGTWLFTAPGSGGPFNVAHMVLSGADIDDVGTFTVSPSDTIRRKAWGGAADFSPNPLDATTAASNTEIIAINNSILAMLAAGDVRRNYFTTGSTWTIGGAAPTGSFKGGGGGGNEVGTSKLANTTMETYQQGSNNLWATGLNCFSCHATNTTSVSHVYPTLNPLF